MAYSKPGVAVTTGSASNVGGNNQAGLTVALIGSFPKGPAWPLGTIGTSYPTPFPIPAPVTYLAANKLQLLSTWGDDYNSNDLAGWTGPGYGRILYENNAGLTPQVLVVRTGTTQASATLPDLSGVVVWTATALLQLGGTMGNGITCQYTSPNFIVTPPAGLSGYATETYNVGAGATWATIATAVNGNSKLVFLNSASADTATTANSTLETLAGGADGANPTLSQINAGTDALASLIYEVQPIHILAPAFADSGVSGVSGAIQHALTDALAMLANGQRPRVIGAVSVTAGGTGNLTNILAMAAALQPSDNSGDDGRCQLWANNQPYRIDPATNNERIYPGWATAAAAVGLRASTPVQQSLGRNRLSGFTRFAENYTEAERTGTAGLLANGVQVARPNGRLVDQPTTAISTSYRRDDNVDNAENWWVADMANSLNALDIETMATQAAGQTIDTHADLLLRGYVEQGIILNYTHTTSQASSDARQWNVQVLYGPRFAVRNINLNVQIYAPPIVVGAGPIAA